MLIISIPYESNMIDRLQIPADLREKIDRELVPGEIIRWIAQPIVRFFTPAARGIFLHGIPWTAFALFWAWSSSGFGASFMNRLTPLVPHFGVVLILIGLSFSFMAKKDALKTAYIITDRRAISFEGHSPMTIRSYLPNQLQSVYRQEKKNGSGNVVITIYYGKDAEGSETQESIRFMDIRDPKGAEQFLKELADINM